MKRFHGWTSQRLFRLLFFFLLMGFGLVLLANIVAKPTAIAGSLFHLAPIQSIPIRLSAGEFDPLVQSEPVRMAEKRLSAMTREEQAYYIVQFNAPIKSGKKEELEQIGAQVFDYLPEFAFIVKMNGATRRTVESMKNVRWVGSYQPGFRLAPVLTRSLTAGKTIAKREFMVTVFGKEETGEVNRQIKQLGGKILGMSVKNVRPKIKVRLNSNQIEAVSKIAGVRWVEPAPVWRLFNDKAAIIMGAPIVWNRHNLYGAGQVVGVADTGLDAGVREGPALHDDFKDGRGGTRVSHLFRLAGDSPSDANGHGTHVAGSVLGNGARSGSDPLTHFYDNSFAGIAPEATLVFQSIENQATGSLSVPDDLNDLFRQSHEAGAIIHSNSWGSDEYGMYDSFSEDTDQYIWNNKDFLILFAAGNSGVDVDGKGVIALYSVNSPATAKNIIAVGATENYRPGGSTPSPAYDFLYGIGSAARYPSEPIKSDHISNNASGMAAFSSRGPCLDGRIKPDIAAPGTNIISTRSSLGGSGWGQGGLSDTAHQFYTYYGGTSMATPLAAGAAALVREFYTRVKKITPSAALLKATLLNGAFDISPGQYGTWPAQEVPNSPRPNNVEGWGRVHLENALFPASPTLGEYQDERAGLSTGESRIYSFTVGDGSVPLKATLVWSDYPGSPASSAQLVNDLDLILIDPVSALHFPSTASRSGKKTVISYYGETGSCTFVSTSRPDVGYAVKFTPGSYPIILENVRLYLHGEAPERLHFRVNIRAADGPGELPGTLLSSKDGTYLSADINSNNWVNVDFPGVTITGGSFYVEYHATDDIQRLKIAMNSTNPHGRSYYFDGATWSAYPGGDIIIQSVVSVEDPTTLADRRNNVEGIDLFTPSAGSYFIRVNGHNIPQGPQPYALVVKGGRISPLVAAVPPLAPDDLSAVCVSNSQIVLKWTDNSENESGFVIERRSDPSKPFSRVSTVGLNTTSYQDSDLLTGTTYYYRLKAFNPAGDSVYSNEAMTTTFQAAPTSAGGSSNCFIATAAYGSHLHPFVKILRDFRDHVLMPSSAGKTFVDWYYRVSPPLARIIAQNGVLSAGIKVMLLPCIGLAWLCLKIGVAPVCLIFLVFCAVIITVSRTARRKRLFPAP